MFRPEPGSLAPPALLAWRRRRRARRICAGTLAMAVALYLASPFTTLWTMASSLRVHDDVALRSSLDWKLVRTGLKQSLGLDHPVQRVSAQDELPGFGESFASGVASGMIDEDITPERLDAMLSTQTVHTRGLAGLPHGFFTSPTRFEVEVRMDGTAPIDITMQIEKWRWKITRITLPQELLTPPSATRLASTRS